MATNTLEIITNKVAAFCGAHGQIQNFGFGTHYKIDTATRQYPLLWMFTRPSSIKTMLSIFHSTS